MLTAISPVKRLMNRYEAQTHLAFKATPKFYQALGINQYRFAQLARGEKNPDSVEIKQLVGFFNQFFPVNADDLLA